MEFDFNTYTLDELFKMIPEIKNLTSNIKLPDYYKPIKDTLEFYMKDPMAYLIYEDVVCPYFLWLIANKDKNKENSLIIARIAKLIDDLLQHEESSVRCVAEVGFLERFVHDLKPTKDVEKYLLPQSLEVAKRVGRNMYGFNWRKGWRIED